MMEIIMGILFLFLLCYEPVAGCVAFRKLKECADSDNYAKIRFYKHAILGWIIPTIVLVLLVALTDLRWREIGIAMPKIDTDLLGSWVSYGALGIGALYLLVVLGIIIGCYINKKIRNAYSEHKKEKLKTSEVAVIYPTTKQEKKWWGYVAFTSGVTEELFYRGFAIFVIAHILPISMWLVIVLSGVLFGLAHLYQGFIKGFVRTSVIGVLFAIIYIVLGSVIPLMALHFFINYSAKVGE